MAEEIDFENGRNSNFEGLVTLTLTFDPAIRHIDLYLYTKFHSNWRNFLWTDGRTDGRTYGRTDIFPLYIIRSTFGSRPNYADKTVQLWTAETLALNVWSASCGSSNDSISFLSGASTSLSMTWNRQEWPSLNGRCTGNASDHNRAAWKKSLGMYMQE